MNAKLFLLGMLFNKFKIIVSDDFKYGFADAPIRELLIFDEHGLRAKFSTCNNQLFFWER